MKHLVVLAIALCSLTVAGSGSTAGAADRGTLAPVTSERTASRIGPHCTRIWSCQGDLCSWQHVCWRGCPDRYSCSPLYGAYGPYGGAAYWGAYSYGNLRSYQ
jgi:hypothetical protein